MTTEKEREARRRYEEDRRLVNVQIDMHKAFHPDTPKRKRAGENLTDLANEI